MRRTIHGQEYERRRGLTCAPQCGGFHGCDETPAKEQIEHLPLVRVQQRRTIMNWKKPEIREVSVGMEINMYACASRS
jgi:coenzyme PQQ precursor peptide PqqA